MSQRITSRKRSELTSRLRDFARANRMNTTNAESKLWAYLRNRNLFGFKFRRQHQIGYYIVDFICIKKNLVIELDGDQHYVGQGPGYDQVRTSYLNSRGLRVVRFTDYETLTNIDGVIVTILEELGIEFEE